MAENWEYACHVFSCIMHALCSFERDRVVESNTKNCKPCHWYGRDFHNHFGTDLDWNNIVVDKKFDEKMLHVYYLINFSITKSLFLALFSF